MLVTKYKIDKMDCTAEESLIRMKLQSLPGIRKLEFDLAKRTLIVYHQSEVNAITDNIDQLNLNSSLLSSESIEIDVTNNEDAINRKSLLLVLLLNFSFFLIEFVLGFIADSMGLVADSLDMLADAFVYGMALMVVGHSLLYKKRVAKLSGYFQMALALLGFIEVIRRYIFVDEVPDYKLMIIISALALAANAASLYILQRSKSKEIHMQASMIFTSNDIIVNAGVIAAGILVLMLGSPLPDLIIGVIIFTMVLRGAVRILKLS